MVYRVCLLAIAMLGRCSNVSFTWPIPSSICSLRVFRFEVSGHTSGIKMTGIRQCIKKLGRGNSMGITCKQSCISTELYNRRVPKNYMGILSATSVRYIYMFSVQIRVGMPDRHDFPMYYSQGYLRVPVRSFDPFAFIRSRNRSESLLIPLIILNSCLVSHELAKLWSTYGQAAQVSSNIL